MVATATGVIVTVEDQCRPFNACSCEKRAWRRYRLEHETIMIRAIVEGADYRGWMLTWNTEYTL